MNNDHKVAIYECVKCYAKYDKHITRTIQQQIRRTISENLKTASLKKPCERKTVRENTEFFRKKNKYN